MYKLKAEKKNLRYGSPILAEKDTSLEEYERRVRDGGRRVLEVSFC